MVLRPLGQRLTPRHLDFPPPRSSDVLAGLSVALVVIPQSLAYAQIAGLPPFVGLFAAALPSVVFALFASSPYLQTGPVATTSLLTFGALSVVADQSETPEYVAAAALLAVLVGTIRLFIGLFRFGWLAFLISEPVVIGFTSAAAVLIMASQFPKTLGVDFLVPGTGTLGDAWWALTHPVEWSATTVALAIATAVVMIGGRRISHLFPGVLLAVVGGLATSRWTSLAIPTAARPDPNGPLEPIPAGLPTIDLQLPWSEAPTLAFSALILALVGFVEPSSIARTFANEDRTSWNASREFFASGLANITAGVSGGYPVGGSFSRSSLNRLAGATTRWSGGITGLLVLAFLSFASVLDTLPLGVLGGIVLAAVYRLIKPRTVIGLWRRSRQKAVLAWVTFAVTIISAPNVHWAVVVGVLMSFAFHLVSPFRIEVSNRNGTEGPELVLKPVGLLWQLSRRAFERQLLRHCGDALAEGRVVVDLADTVTVDAETVTLLRKVAAEIAPRPLAPENAPLGQTAKLASVLVNTTKPTAKVSPSETAG